MTRIKIIASIAIKTGKYFGDKDLIHCEQFFSFEQFDTDELWLLMDAIQFQLRRKFREKGGDES